MIKDIMTKKDTHKLQAGRQQRTNGSVGTEYRGSRSGMPIVSDFISALVPDTRGSIGGFLVSRLFGKKLNTPKLQKKLSIGSASSIFLGTKYLKYYYVKVQIKKYYF